VPSLRVVLLSIDRAAGALGVAMQAISLATGHDTVGLHACLVTIELSFLLNQSACLGCSQLPGGQALLYASPLLCLEAVDAWCRVGESRASAGHQQCKGKSRSQHGRSPQVRHGSWPVRWKTR